MYTFYRSVVKGQSGYREKTVLESNNVYDSQTDEK